MGLARRAGKNFPHLKMRSTPRAARCVTTTPRMPSSSTPIGVVRALPRCSASLMTRKNETMFTYSSRSLKSRERNYSSDKGELLASMWGCYTI